MFPFDQGGKISFQGARDDEEQQDLFVDNELLAAINLPTASTAAATSTTAAKNTTEKAKGQAQGRGRGRKSGGVCRVGAGLSSGGGGPAVGDLGFDMKKILHRNIEKQRRQEMSGLFSTLQSLLPLEYVKGKRTMSDNLDEAVNYIKGLQKNIKELGDKRDRLRMIQDSSSCGCCRTKEESSSSNSCNIAIYPNVVGLEVQITVTKWEDGFALSSAVKLLLEEGFSVVSCVSNKANGSILHIIQCQVTDMTCFNIDVQQLQQRLHDAVCS